MRDCVVEKLASSVLQHYWVTKNIGNLSIFYDSNDTKERLDEIWDGLVKTRGGGIVVILASKDYFDQVWCLAELLAARSLYNCSDEKERIRLCFIAVGMTVEQLKENWFMKMHATDLLTGNNAAHVYEISLPEAIGRSEINWAVNNLVNSVAKTIVELGSNSLAVGSGQEESFHVMLEVVHRGYEGSTDYSALLLKLKVQENQTALFVMGRDMHGTPQQLKTFLTSRGPSNAKDASVKALGAYERKWLSDWSRRDWSICKNELVDCLKQAQSLLKPSPKVSSKWTYNAVPDAVPASDDSDCSSTQSDGSAGFVGVDFTRRPMNQDASWNRKVIECGAFLERKLKQVERFGTIAFEHQSPSVVVERIKDDDPPKERAIAILECVYELRNDLRRKDLEYLQQIYKSLRILLISCGAEPDEVQEYMVGAIWQGSFCMILEICSSVLDDLFAKVVDANWNFPIGYNGVTITELSPAFKITMPFFVKVKVPEGRQVPDVDVWLLEEDGAQFLLPTSDEARSCIMQGGRQLSEFCIKDTVHDALKSLPTFRPTEGNTLVSWHSIQQESMSVGHFLPSLPTYSENSVGHESPLETSDKASTVEADSLYEAVWREQTNASTSPSFDEVVGTVAAVIDLITVVYNKYKSFQALKEENEEFRRTMLAVRGVLHDIREEERSSRRESLRRPLQLIEDAIEMGEKVMRKCSDRKNKLKIALICSQDYVNTLKAAGVKMNHGLTMITATSVNIQADTQGAMDTAQRAIESMQTRLDAYHNHIADILLDIIRPGIQNIPDEVLAKLRKEGIVSSKQDCIDQIRDIQKDPDVTELKNEQLIQWALHVSLPPSNRATMDRLTCPISLDYMRDPVTLVQSGQTYDKEFLCESLLRNPDLCPKTGLHFKQKLNYISNYDAREDLTYYLGDDAYQPYDDSIFKRQYEAFWRERMNVSTSPIDELAALLFGMNRRRVDWVAAQDVVNDTTHEDAIMTGFKALLLHPNSFQNSKLRKNEAESLQFWRRAEELGLSAECNASNKYAQYVKGRYCDEVLQDYARARHFYELAAELGNAVAQTKLGYLYRNGQGITQDYAKARRFYELAAEQGDASAQTNLGNLYEKGRGIKQDYAKARHFYELGADQGDAVAQSNLGILYYHGRGITQDYAKARLFYELAAEQGHAVAQTNLGILYYHGRGITQDYVKARHFYELAAEQGDASAQNNLGYLYYQGRGVTQDYAKARHFYERAAEQGHAVAQFNLGNLYDHGHGGTQDYAKARHFYELAAEQGHAAAQYNLGILYDLGHGETQDYAKARHFYELAAEQGNASAQYNLGILYDLGQGETQDYAKARHFYERAAEQGHAVAQTNLGNLYDHGHGVMHDYAKARHFYELGADQGDAVAQFNLGNLYDHGRGITQDYAKARHFYELAAEQGDASAQIGLGYLYHQGLGVTQDYAKARHFYELAAEQGDAFAQFNLGNLYDHGHGVTQDYAKARHFYELAAEQGHSAAQYNLGFLYDLGQGETQDYAKARHFYEVAAEQGNASAQYNLGILYDLGHGETQDYAKACHFYKLAAEQGHAAAQFNLGYLYDEGLGVTQDYAKARHFYQLAADQGNAFAQFNLGYLYDHGHGVTQDYAKARHFYELAAEQGDASAQIGLGYLYHQGLGVTQDYAKARHFYELAAEQSNALAQFNLGNLYYHGLGITQDCAKARHFYELAAEQGDAFAQFNLGYLYHQGLGVTQDYAKARHFYELAAEQGNVSAQYNLAAEQGNVSAQHNLGLLYEFGKGVPVNKEKARHYYGLAAAHGHEDAHNKLETKRRPRFLLSETRNDYSCQEK
jgi:hypothetical protein